MAIDQTIFELLLRWYEVHAEDPSFTVEDLCEDCPQHVEPLRRYLAAVTSMEVLLGIQGMSDNGTLDHADGATTDLRLDTEHVQIPGLELLSVLDQGGMGIVYRARQVSANRIVALKMILGPRQTTRNLARFRRETEALARFQHANIVHVYDVGEHGGRPYYTMEFIEGGNLASHLRKGAMPPRESAQLCATLARAVHAAHEQNIIHRDLKPSNVFLAAGNVPKIGDFGLAKNVDHQTSSSTQTGEIVGTPAYMAPEQAEGRTSDIGPAVDIYALGAILYEMLAGRPPFLGETPLQILRQVSGDDPINPRALRADVPRDLEAICLKCLEKTPNRRYLSAKLLADDLDNAMHGRPITARPSNRLGRMVKWARRRPEMALLTAFWMIAALALIVFALRHVLEEHRLRAAAVAAAPQAREILKRHCWECHGEDPDTTERELDVLNHALLLDPRRNLVVAGAAEDSRLIQRIEDDSMPPEENELTLPRVSELELNILRVWIMGGAPDFPPEDPANPTPPVVADSELALQAKRIFAKRCYECHSYKEAKGGIKIMDYRMLVTTRKVVVPRKPEMSELFDLITRTGKGVMPPWPDDPLTAEEIETVRRWINEGAPPFPKGE